jgi:hypothetical protein
MPTTRKAFVSAFQKVVLPNLNVKKRRFLWLPRTPGIDVQLIG